MLNYINQLRNYLILIRFDKPIGTVLLLWPTLWGLWLANSGFPEPKLLVIFMVGVFLMRSAGCVINDLADRNFDGSVARTANRPLVAKSEERRVSVKEAVTIVILFCISAFMLVLSLHNVALIYHSIIALMLASIYPLCKRFFACPQFVLGLAFGYAIPMAYVASGINYSMVTWLLYTASIVLTIIYDTFYAMSDIVYDRKLGLQSSAIWLHNLVGKYDLLVLALLQLVFLINLIAISYLLEFSFYYWFIFAVLLLFVYQLKLVSTRQSEQCLAAFRNNNWVGLLVFLGFVIEYL
jgi:4-hydroxybenzoate polyprenyltransferase